MSFNPLNYPLCFEKPLRLTDITSWHEHIPFAFTIVQMLKPKIFVELGTHKGDSYCAFCQAVNALGLDTACYAVDTWEGDEHSGIYGPEILEELRTYHDSQYKGFSLLIQSRFEEALNYFSDGSIDLIHIDGCHTYEAVKHDFETWLLKMSQRGVVLFHDINVHEREFRVWKFWEEVAEHYPSFEFKHGYGLGVLAVGAEVPDEVLDFLNIGGQEVATTTKLYSYLGDKIALGHQLQVRDGQITELNSAMQDRDGQITELNSAMQDRDGQITELNSILQARDSQITELNSILQARDGQITELNSALQSMQQSIVWRLLMKYQRLIDTLLPHTTKRRHVYDLGIISIRIIVNDGLSVFLYRFKEKVHGSALNASKIALIQTNLNSPHAPLSLKKNLCGKFTFPTNNLNEVRFLTATYQRRNSDIELHITNTDGQIIRKSSVKGYKIQNNEYTSFKFKPIKDSNEQTLIFRLISKGEQSAAVWYNKSVTFPELSLIYDDDPLNGSIGFQAFANIGIKSRYDLWILKNEPTLARLEHYKKEIDNFEYQPKVSILTPVYNPDVAWIKAAIESVINQVYGNWELCLADASTKDEVKKCLEAYAKKDSRIKVKFVSKNKGISGNSNEALSFATGEYIGLLDHDDELSPDALYEVVKHLQTNRNADMIYSDEDKIDLDGNRSIPFFKPEWSLPMFLSTNYICHFLVYKKSLIQNVSGFREKFDGSQDYDLALRVVDKISMYNIYHIPKILYHWRITQLSTASGRHAKPYAYAAGKKALEEYLLRNHVKGEVQELEDPGSYRVKKNIKNEPSVDIIIIQNSLDKYEHSSESFQSNLTKLISQTQNKPRNIYTSMNINMSDIVKYLQLSNEQLNKIINNSDPNYIIFMEFGSLVKEPFVHLSSDWIEALIEHFPYFHVGVVGTGHFIFNNIIHNVHRPCGRIFCVTKNLLLLYLKSNIVSSNFDDLQINLADYAESLGYSNLFTPHSVGNQISIELMNKYYLKSNKKSFLKDNMNYYLPNTTV